MNKEILRYKEIFGDDLVSKEEALEKGFKHFFTGKACRNGHISINRISSRGKSECMECDRIQAAKRREKLPWKDLPEEKKQRVLERGRIIDKTNKARTRKVIYNRKWRKDNPEKISARNAAKKKKVRQATPSWLTKEHKKELQNIYGDRRILSEVTGIEFHVDHIYPIKGKDVCGLHVPWNLQLMEWRDNIVKSNTNIQVNTLKQEN